MKKLIVNKELEASSMVMNALGYKKEKEEPTIYKNITRVTYFKEIEVNPDLVKKYMIRSIVPFLYVIIPSALAFILATVFVILTFALKGQVDVLNLFFMLMLPAFILIIISTALSLKRYFDMLHNYQALASVPIILKEREK